MKRKPKPSPTLTTHAELLDDLERVLLKARDTGRPVVEFLLWMAFLEELKGLDQTKTVKPRVKRAGNV